MLYFYCCDVMTRERRTIRIDGCKPFNKRIETKEEYQEAQEFIRQDLFETLHQLGEILNIDEMEIHFNAFNPL